MSQKKLFLSLLLLASFRSVNAGEKNTMPEKGKGGVPLTVKASEPSQVQALFNENATLRERVKRLELDLAAACLALGNIGVMSKQLAQLTAGAPVLSEVHQLAVDIRRETGFNDDDDDDYDYDYADY